MPRRKLLIEGALVLMCAMVLLSWVTWLTPYVRDRVVTALNERFESQVELASLRVAIFPRPAVLGEGLVLRHMGRTDVPPLISIKSFSAGAGLFGLIGKPLRLRTVELDGLEIRVPPGGLGRAVTDGASPKAPTPRPPVDPDTAPPASASAAPRDQGPSPLVVDKIVSIGARLEIASKKTGKPGRVFEIHDLVMHEFGLDRPATFEASLINPKPEGRIDTKGEFGPWQKEEPRLTPLDGEYVFKNANLDTIKGIGGILSSTGRFGGLLDRIDVQGETDTPDFVVDIAGQPVQLKTRFKAVVDGTSGNTWLDPVDAAFLKSVAIARGGVVKTEDVRGRTISLDVTIEDARLEDLLKFAIKSPRPPLTGQVKLTMKFLLPPGEQDVVQKLQLDGRFDLVQARFTTIDVQKKINTLSRRGRGDTDDSDGESVVSNLAGRFVLKNGVLSFSELTFRVPGATVRLAGSYGLESEQIDFAGNLLLDAKLSETTTGFKSVLLKAVDPFFNRKGGGAKLPIKVSGTRAKPSFGLDVRKALTPGE